MRSGRSTTRTHNVATASGDALEASAEEDGCAEKVRRMSLHEVHGDNVRLKDDGSGARRADGFRKGVVFSARPVGADEKVKVRVTSCCTQWSGALRLGFTAHDPATMKGNVPSSAFPNLKNTPGNWVAKLEESLAAEGTELSFCVTYKGDMIVCVNDEEGEVVLSGVDTTRPLWAMVDIFGNTTGIELTLPDTSPDLEPVVFHEICGANVRLAEEGRLAQRVGDFCKGVTFSSRPVYLSERLFLRVKESCTQWSGSLRLGFTSNDPALSQGTLPSSSYPHLKNSPGNWVKVLDESYAKVDNLIHFCVNDMGEGLIGVNGGEEKVFLKGIDVSGNLWALIDIYGNTVTVEMAEDELGLNNKEEILAKARMSLLGSGATASVCGQKPVSFHYVHGDNVLLEEYGRVARRAADFCKGIVFSNRPIPLRERVVFRIAECCNQWSGTLRLGFTSHDPETLEGSLPASAIPDMTQIPGNWVKTIDHKYAREGAVLHYYVNDTGDMFFGAFGKDRGLLMKGVNTTETLWAVIDIYGYTTAVEMVDERSLPVGLQDMFADGFPENGDGNKASLKEDDNTPWTPLAFHSIMGPNARLDPQDSQVAERCDPSKRRAYAFLSRPLVADERLLVQVAGVQPSLSGSLSFGLTTCDPASLEGKTAELPSQLEDLLDRPEYWVFQIGIPCGLDDKLVFVTRKDGKVEYSRNGGPFESMMHIDGEEEFYVFFDIAGQVTKIRLIGTKGGPAVGKDKEAAGGESN